MLRFTIFIAWILATASSICAAEWTVRVSAGRFNRRETPIFALLPEAITVTDSLQLIEKETGHQVPTQMLDDGLKIAWILQRPLMANEDRDYTITRAKTEANPSSAAIRCIRREGHLLVQAKGRPVLQYNMAVNQAPAGIDKIQSRNAYIHPVFSPSGKSITDDFAPDHPHQRGIFFAWTKCRFADKDINFWEIQQGLGKVEHVRLEDATDGNVFGQVVVKQRFVDTHHPEMPVEILDETWTIRVFNIASGFLIDLQSDQFCTADSPLVIGPYHYGGLGIRGRREWLGTESSFEMTTSEGLDRNQGNHTRPRWIDFGGELDGDAVGMTSLDHPDNFRFPQPVRLHPDKPYFCFAPLVIGEFEIGPDQTYTSKYRFYVYDGPKDAIRNQQIWSDYASPPRVTVVSTP